MTDQSERKYYRDQGKVNWVRFVPWLFASFFVSVLMAWILNLAMHAGYYLIIIAPVFASLVVAGMLFVAVQQGQCRNRWVAGICGIFMGVTLYLGYFYAGLVEVIGIENISHVELLPRYIQYRMNSDRVRDSSESDTTFHRKGAPKNNSSDDEATPEASSSPLQVMGNWGLFVIEFGLVLFLTSGIAVGRAKRGYCEKCQDWMEQELAAFQPETGLDFLAALEKGQLATIINSRKVPILQRMPFTGVAVNYCGAAIAGRSQCPVYFSIKDIKVANLFGGGQGGKFDAAQGKLILNRAELMEREIIELANLFPTLSSLANTTAVPVRPDDTGANLLPTIELKPVLPGYEGKVLTRKNNIQGNLCGLLVLAAFFGGMATFLGGIYFLSPDESTPRHAISALRIAGSIAMIVCGATLGILGGSVGLGNPSAPGNRLFLARTRKSFRSRPERWLDLDDIENIFVEMVPRKNWGRIMLEKAEDIGFLQIDEERREILFEGDRECYRIPTEAIISCELERVATGSDESKSIVHYMIVIRAHKGSAIWETSLAPRWIAWNVNNNKRWARAEEIQRRILSLMNPAVRSV